jgi:hypothetical protein
MKPTLERISPVNLRFLLLMRHAKHTEGREKPKAPAASPLADIASSLRELAQGSAAMRGASIGRGSDSGTEEAAGVLSGEGKKETRGIALRLKESHEWEEDLRLAGILHAKSNQAKDTADAVRACEAAASKTNPSAPRTIPVITTRALKSRLLGPTAKAPVSKKAELRTANGVVKLAEKILGHESFGNAVLFVGHQPAIGWLASALVGTGVPVAHSEILCLDLKAEGRPALRWTISSAGETTLQDLYDKIKSKMTLANVLSGFITAGIGLLLGMVAEKQKVEALGVQAAVVFVAAGYLVVAVALYLLTMFSYDRLVMPIRFWAELPSGKNCRPPWVVARPPSGAHWVLYQNMMRVWQWQFMPATFLALSGLFMLWSAVFWGTWGISRSEHWQWTAIARSLSLAPPVMAFLWILLAKREDIAAGLAAGQENFRACSGFTMKFRYLCGPWLGSED